jgi:hypothetical protein
MNITQEMSRFEQFLSISEQLLKKENFKNAGLRF